MSLIKKNKRFWNFAVKVWIPLSASVGVIKTLFFDIPDIFHKLGSSAYLVHYVIEALELVAKYTLIGIAILVGGAFVSWPLRLFVWPMWAGLILYFLVHGGRNGLGFIYLMAFATIFDLLFPNRKSQQESDKPN